MITDMHLASLLADQDFKWYYWLGPLLAVSFLGVVLMLSGGYIKKVLIPKYRGKRVDE